MYDSIEKAISDMDVSTRFGPSKIKPGKWDKAHIDKDIFMTPSAGPMEMNIMNTMGCNQCSNPVYGNMVAPQMIHNQVPECMLKVYKAYPYMNPNR